MINHGKNAYKFKVFYLQEQMQLKESKVDTYKHPYTKNMCIKMVQYIDINTWLNFKDR